MINIKMANGQTLKATLFVLSDGVLNIRPFERMSVLAAAQLFSNNEATKSMDAEQYDHTQTYIGYTEIAGILSESESERVLVMMKRKEA